MSKARALELDGSSDRSFDTYRIGDRDELPYLPEPPGFHLKIGIIVPLYWIVMKISNKEKPVVSNGPGKVRVSHSLSYLTLHE